MCNFVVVVVTWSDRTSLKGRIMVLTYGLETEVVRVECGCDVGSGGGGTPGMFLECELLLLPLPPLEDASSTPVDCRDDDCWLLLLLFLIIIGTDDGVAVVCACFFTVGWLKGSGGGGGGGGDWDDADDEVDDNDGCDCWWWWWCWAKRLVGSGCAGGGLTICEGEYELDTYMRKSFIDLDKVIWRLFAAKMLLMSFCDAMSICLMSICWWRSPPPLVLCDTPCALLAPVCWWFRNSTDLACDCCKL